MLEGKIGKISSIIGAPLLPEASKETVHTEVQQMLKYDIIRPSASPWASPVVMVHKKDGSWHFCIDYRKLNSVTNRDAYPLPRIDATLNSLAGCRYFTTFDLASGCFGGIRQGENSFLCTNRTL